MSIYRHTSKIAGILLAAIALSPMVTLFLDASPVLYVVASLALSLLALSTPSVWRLQNPQIIWLLLILTFSIILLLSTVINVEVRQPFLPGFYFLSTLAVGIFAILGWHRNFYDTFARTIILGTVLVSLLVIYGYVLGGDDFRRYWGPVYLIIGTTTSVGFCLSLPYLLATTGIQRIRWLVIVLLCAFGIVMGQARGAVVFSAFFLILVLCFYWPRKEHHYQFATGLFGRLSVISIGIIIVALFLPYRQASRFERILEGKEFQQGRVDFWLESIRAISESPIIGRGVGYSVTHHHPHNLFLQVGLDAGLSGILVLAFFICWPLYMFFSTTVPAAVRKQPLTWGFLGAYIVLILDYSKSYDFYKSRILFLIAGAFIGHIALQRRLKC